MLDRFVSPIILSDDGTSRLFRAVDTSSGQEAIIRVFSTQSYEEWQALNALLTALATLKHPHIERIDEVIQGDNELTVITEIPEENSLSKITTVSPLSVDEFKTVALQLLDALSSAHDQGIVHGSLNADCIRVQRDGTEWIAKITGYGSGFGQAGKDGEMDAYLCVPPEQWEQEPARRRSDVYSLGCILYRALAGRSPFDGKTLKEVRYKHINHDLRPLQQLAPHAPDWICGWVMSLVQAAPEKRPKSATEALDEYRRAELACAYPAPGGAAAMISNLAATAGYAPMMRASTYHVPTPSTNAVYLPVQAAPVRKKAPGPVSPARPAQAKLPSPARSVSPVSQSEPPNRKKILIGAGIAASLIIIATIVALSGGKSEPVKVAANPQGPIRVTSPAQSKDLPPVGTDYPSGRAKPPNYPQLVLHVMADAGVSTNPGSTANLLSPVMAWKDYSDRGREATLRQGNIGTERAIWEIKKPDLTFPLSREHRFIEFPGAGSPSAGLTVSGMNQSRDFPFGQANPAPERGLTFAMVVHQEVTGRQMTVLHVSSGQGYAVLRFAEKGELRLSLRVTGVPDPSQLPSLQIGTDKFNPIEPLLVTGFWRSSPPEAQLRVRDGSGRTFQTPIGKPPLPKDALSTVLIGRDFLPSATSANQSQDPKTLKAFKGGIAEVLLYSTALNEPDLTKLEADLAARYFPRQP